MERILFTPWSIALFMSCTIHAGMLYSVNLKNSDTSFVEQMRTIEVSLLPTLPQQKNTLVLQKKMRTQITQSRPVIQPQEALQALEPEVMTELATSASDIPMAETTIPQVQAPRFNAAYLNNPPPAYPLAARRRNIEGKVWVRAQVQADGSCSQVELKIPSASRLLDQATLDAVKKWRFVPATLRGETVVAWVEIPITFKLNN